MSSIREYDQEIDKILKRLATEFPVTASFLELYIFKLQKENAQLFDDVHSKS